ncbi:breast cancer type 2 susceptibility protein isoform X2 [Gouania willdenowi]|uniref:breast cancer type 2 susceptibility protein isoform X2 n=1 Tax=Gouania willdenowi TaxID=441366 RepID=UPI0010553275|nr:breast cancer type 2 susceptibility protein isoform X2 [Gouania willdenowi]
MLHKPAMDLTSKNMYDTFKDKIWKELGPLDPNWFDILSRQASAEEGNASDQDELCANQEGNFKVPSDKTGLNSQPFSTPKVFRHRRVVSPHTQDDTFTAEQEKEALPWTATHSPHFLGVSKQGVSEVKHEEIQPPSEISFELLHTPNISEVSHAKCISESLGAQINPDISWTSSLNTPPAVPSTLILTKNNESLTPGGITAGENVVIVQKLFPSLSNISKADASSSKSKEITAVFQDALHPEDSSHNIPQPSSNQTEEHWQQKLPDAIKDGEIRNAITSVLDGAENALSIFFANSSSALRKVKPVRIQRKQIVPTKEHSYSSQKPTTTSANASSTKEKRSEQKSPGVPVTPPTTSKAEPGMSQWSPLSLSQIPAGTADISTKRSQNYLNSERLVRPQKIAAFELIKKKRTFVYNIGGLKPPAQSKETPRQMMDSSLQCRDSEQEGSDTLVANIPNEKECNSNQNNVLQIQGHSNQEKPQPRVQDCDSSDMSQLCREFANDFSQIIPFSSKEIDGLKKNQSQFSPSVCLSAVKQAKQKARLSMLQHDVDMAGIRYPTDDGSKGDSGFLSAAVDTATMTTSDVHGPSNTCGSPPCLKPIIHSTPPFQSTTKEILQNDYNVLIEETPQHSELDSERSCDIRTQSTSPQQRAISNPPSLPLKADVSHSYPHTSGFKTASNKGITISLSNLAKAKILLEETENQTSVGQPAKCGKAIQHKPLGTNAPVKDKTCKSNVKLSPKESRNDSCPLTASQKADVTELCTLLEEANSQFEFTQFKTTVIKQQAGNTSSQTLDKELDSDLLTGIDFDDSFSSNAQKDMTMTIMPKKKNPVMDITSCEISDAKRKPPEEPKKEISSIGVDIVSQDMCSPSSTKTRYPQRNEQAELSESDNDYAMLKGGFKTAGENVLRVSKKCLFKARNLFADLEERPTYRKIEKESKVKHNLDFNKGSESPKVNPKGHVEQVGTSFSDEQVLNLESEAALIFGSTSLNGFQLASGKAISVSAKHLEQANDLFKEFGVFENGCSAFGREGNCNKSPAKSSNGKKLSKLKNVVLSMKSIAEKKAEGVIAINDKPSLSNAISIHGNLLTNSTSPPFYPTTKDSESSAIEQLNNKDGICLTNVEDATMSNNGFVAASGKSVTLSSEALQKARALFNDISLDSTTSSHTKRRDEKQENIPKVNCGYMTVAGKKVPVSKKNLRKSKPFFKAFDKAGSPEAMAEMEAFIKNRNVPSELCSSTVYNEETEKRCTENTGKLKMENLNTLPRQNIGFQTASGKGVTISSEALKKAKSLLSECEKCNDANTISSEEFKKRQTPLKECEERVLKSGQPSSSSSGLPAADNSQVTPSLEPILKHKDLFRDVNLKTDFSTDTLKYDENQAYPGHLRRVDFGFTTAKGAKISVSHKGLLKARHLMKDFEESVSTHFYEKDEFKEDHETPAKDGTNTQLLSRVCYEKKGHKPDLNVAERIFEKGCNDDMLSMVKGKPTHMSLHNCGFKTAAGKGVNISFNALEKAKTLLGEHEWQKDKIGVNPPQNITVVSQSCPPCSSNGFLAASDKQLAVSSKALHKAKALFSDIHFSTDTSNASDKRTSDVKHEAQQKEIERGNNRFGFTTAGGAKVHVSEESLSKASQLFKDCAGPAIDRSIEKNGNSCNLPNTNEKDMPMNDSVSLFVTLQEASNASEDTESFCANKINKSNKKQIQEEKSSQAGLAHDFPKEKTLLDCNGDQVACHQKLEVLQLDESSTLSEVQSFNLTGCSETQQMLFVQEALDCTKALLQDEGLPDHSLSLTLESEPQHDSLKSIDRASKEYQRKGKRRIDDKNIPGHPPLKRRLLDEFDQTIGGTNTMFHPVKSFPNALIKDRGSFIYSDSLQPNITGPHRDAKRYFEAKSQNTTSAQYLTKVDGKSMGSRTPGFAPPFIGNLKPKTSESAMTKNSTKSPAFVPPFKKRSTMVQEIPLQPQAEEDKCSKLNLKPPTSTFKPPMEKTDDVSHLSDNTMDTVNKKQGLTVGCGTASSGTKAQSTDDSLFRCQDLQKFIELARDMQDMRIQKKKRQTIRPLPGSLFLTKTSGVERVPLKVAVNRIPPGKYTSKQLYSHGVHNHVSEVSSETAESFRFSLLQYFKKDVFADNGGVQLGDGGWLIPSNDGTAGKEEFYRALCDTPGVDPKLISEAWVYNHYRWIVWKQASMERCFPEVMGSLCLTPEQVLLQLKYRYDVEVDHSRRPALRKITEKDDTAAKTLVLCVCGIVTDGLSTNEKIHNDAKTPQGADPQSQSPAAVIWLTDGWYAIKAQLDKPLTAMVHRGRLAVGGKLMVHGAQLVGSQDACPPLEAPESLMLKICANSCRPVRWDVKLGFYKDPRPFLLPVSCLYSDGGPVGCVDIIILRSYPIQWMERTPDGVVFRSIRAEEKEARQYNTRKHIAMEALFAKLQAEFEQEEKAKGKSTRRRQTLNRQDIASLQDGEELYEAVGDDPAHLQAHLSEQQLEILQSFRRSLMDKKQAELQDRYRRALEVEGNEGNELSFPKRDVTTVWRLCFTDAVLQSSRVYQLNLWRPPSDVQSLLKEGSRYKVYNLSTTEGKKRSCVESLQFTGTKKTRFEEMQVR